MLDWLKAMFGHRRHSAEPEPRRQEERQEQQFAEWDRMREAIDAKRRKSEELTKRLRDEARLRGIDLEISTRRRG